MSDSNKVMEELTGTPPREVTVDEKKDVTQGQVNEKVHAEDHQREFPVHEVFVQLDEPVLDPNSPEAVQVPLAGQGDTSLPIHLIAGKSPEQQFAEAPKSDAPAKKS